MKAEMLKDVKFFFLCIVGSLDKQKQVYTALQLV